MSGSSVKTLEHFSQIYRTDEFKQFDYGKRKNLEVYGRISPPRYNLDKVSTPVVLFYSKNDHLLDEQGVKKLANLLPNVIHKEALPKYSHMDYLFGNDAPKILYSKILKILRKTMQFRYIC